MSATAASGAGVLQLSAVEHATLQVEPYCWATLDGVLEGSAAAELARTFPSDGFASDERLVGAKSYRFRSRRLVERHGSTPSGTLPPLWQALIGALSDPAYRDALASLTGVALERAEQELTLWRYDGGCWLAPHPDRQDKLLSHILYFNRSWDARFGGTLRILRSADVHDVAAEIAPSTSTSVVIVRSDRSWHAVTPVHPEAGDIARLSLASIFYRGDVGGA
jgi:hypothetical protein